MAAGFSKRTSFSVTRRGFMAGTAAVAGSLAAPAVVRAQERKKWDRKIIAALNSRPGDPTDISIRRIPEILAEKHNVDVTIEIYPSSQLAHDIGQIEGVQNGVFDIASNATASLNPFTDALAFMDLPFLFSTWDQALSFVTGDVMKQQFAKAESDMPIKMLPIVGAGGFRVFTNKLRPVKTPDDLKGMKIRSSFGGSQIDLNALLAWQAVPVPLGWAESYTSAQQGIVDGIFVQPIWTDIAGFYEILKEGTIVPSNWVGQVQLLNGDTWKQMPDDIKGPFMEAAQEAADEGNKLDHEQEAKYIADLESKGVKFYTPNDAEMAQWREPALATWDKSGLNPDLLAKLKG